MPLTENNKKIAILIPSYNDVRISRAIQSVKEADKDDISRIYVIDGNSKEEVKLLINQMLRSFDVFISEPDKGVFDALNKGIELVKEKYIGWIGTDDIYSEGVDLKTIVKELEENDLDVLACDTAHTQIGIIKRISKAHSLSNIRIGFHNPHFSTFLSKESVGNLRFNFSYYGNVADIPFFIKYFRQHNLKYKYISKVVCYQELGGISTSSAKAMLSNHFKLISLMAREFGLIFSLKFVLNKVVRKRFVNMILWNKQRWQNR